MVKHPVDLGKSPSARFWSGLTTGVGASLVVGFVGVYLALSNGALVISVNNAPILTEVWYWLHDNMRMSVVPFALLLLWYLLTLRALRVELNGNRVLTLIQQFDRFTDLQAMLFFGVGVIWTAIGLRSALLGALGDLDAQTAHRMGAFSILQALVDEGILLALSTTIVGGVGGYLMRILKSLTVGTRLDTFYESLRVAESEQVLERLDAIERSVRSLVLHEGATKLDGSSSVRRSSPGHFPNIEEN